MLTSAQRRPADLLIRRARVVDPQAGLDEYLDISIRRGTIAGIGHHLAATPGQEEVDGSTWTVMPGFVDPHVHVRAPGGEGTEDIASGTRAAAHGGYVGIVSMPNTTPVIDTPEVLDALHRRAATDAVVPIGFAAAISVGQQGEQLTEMRRLAAAGAVAFTDDGLPVRSAALLRRALQYQSVVDRPIALHCEDPDLSGGAMHEGAVSARLGIQGIPDLAESLMVARDVRLAGSEGGHVHLQHLSCAASLHEVAWARGQGWRVTSEVTPHHLLLTEDAAATLDTGCKMNPPLRTAADREALVEGLRVGTIDCIATDHAPHGGERKRLPFEHAPFGVTGLETAFSSLYTALVLPGRLTLSTLVSALSWKPARVFGLPQPRIAVGELANLCAWELEATWTVDAGEMESKASNTPFDGRTLSGTCQLTLAGGQLAWQPVRELAPA